MALLPASSTPNSNPNIADLFTKPLSFSRHRFTATTLIGDEPTTPTTSVVAPTVVASASVPTATPVSDSVPTLHPNLALAPTLPIVLDTGASFSRTPFASDSLPVTQAPCGLIRSPTSVVSNSKAYSAFASTPASTPVDPHTLITGEDAVDSVDLSSPDTTIDSDSGLCPQAFTLLHLIPLWIALVSALLRSE